MIIDDPEAYLSECTRIEPLALEEEYVRLPGDMAYWNGRYADVYRHWLEVKVQRDLVYHRLHKDYREALENKANGTRITIKEVESMVAQDSDYLDVKAKELVAESEKIRLYGVMEALRAKKDMLISLGAHIRLEMGNDPLVRHQRATSREVQQSRG